jgi:hypothetical protein
VRATARQISFADWELMRQRDQGIRLEPLLEAISGFLDDQRDVIERHGRGTRARIRRERAALFDIKTGSRTQEVGVDAQPARCSKTRRKAPSELTRGGGHSNGPARACTPRAVGYMTECNHDYSPEIRIEQSFGSHARLLDSSKSSRQHSARPAVIPLP